MPSEIMHLSFERRQNFECSVVVLWGSNQS